MIALQPMVSGNRCEPSQDSSTYDVPALAKPYFRHTLL